MVKNPKAITFEKALECITNLINFETDTTPTFRASMEQPKASTQINFYTPQREDELENISPKVRGDTDYFGIMPRNEEVTSPSKPSLTFVQRVE
jgi:hypothetical protein